MEDEDEFVVEDEVAFAVAFEVEVEFVVEGVAAGAAALALSAEGGEAFFSTAAHVSLNPTLAKADSPSVRHEGHELRPALSQ